jgi:hypothetical protein
MRWLHAVLPLVAARLSCLPWLVVVASPLVALPRSPDTVACDGSGVRACVPVAAGEGGGV